MQNKEINGMIYCHEIQKWVTIEEYTDYYYTNQIRNSLDNIYIK